jgi:hypothetical protein
MAARMEPTIEDRSILVIDSRGDIAAALRSRVPPSRAYVIRRAPDEADEAVAALVPFPFAVVGITRDTPPTLLAGLRELLATKPVPIVWQGGPPDDLPAHAVLVDDLAECRERVAALVDADIAGVTLADFRGIDWDGRELRGCCALEGVVSLPEGPWRLPAALLAEVGQTIAAAGLPLRLEDAGGGAIRLCASVSSVTRA